MSRISRSSTLLVIVAALAIVATACSSSGSSDGATTTIHQDAEIAPSFVVPTMDGQFSLAEHLASDGRPIFLNLWASWCFPCREEMPAIDESSQAFPEVAFVGVSVQDARTDAEAFAEEIGVTYIIGFDEQNDVDAAYQPLGLPASYIIDSNGIIVERIFGKVTEEDLAAKFALHFDL
ncbi:MAG: TlpA disulfide reductase family protein [Actinomycetota bacterium]